MFEENSHRRHRERGGEIIILLILPFFGPRDTLLHPLNQFSGTIPPLFPRKPRLVDLYSTIGSPSNLYMTPMLPLFRPCFALISPLFVPYFTFLSRIPSSTLVSPLSPFSIAIIPLLLHPHCTCKPLCHPYFNP